MEPPATPEDAPGRPEPARADWRSLTTLRDRVDAAAREIERLRAENAALGKRLVDLQDHAAAPSFSLAGLDADEDPAALRERVRGFIDLVDGLLAAPATDAPTASGPDDDR